MYKNKVVALAYCPKCGNEVTEIDEESLLCEPCYNGKIQWTRINNDSNGNPRYVCHYFNLLSQAEIEINYNKEVGRVDRYALAVERANKIGGRKFHNKQYGGGIVFQSYNLQETERYIREAIEKAL